MSEPQCTAQIAGKDGDGASRVGNDRRDADKYQRRERQKGAASRNRVQYTCGECCGGKNGLVDHKSSLRNTVKNNPSCRRSSPKWDNRARHSSAILNAVLGYAIEHSERAMVANRRTDLLIKGQPLHRHTSNCSPDSAKAVETTEMLLYIVVTGEGSTATSDWSVIRYARENDQSVVRRRQPFDRDTKGGADTSPPKPAMAAGDCAGDSYQAQHE